MQSLQKICKKKRKFRMLNTWLLMQILKKFTDHAKRLPTFIRAYYLKKNNFFILFAPILIVSNH